MSSLLSRQGSPARLLQAASDTGGVLNHHVVDGAPQNAVLDDMSSRSGRGAGDHSVDDRAAHVH